MSSRGPLLGAAAATAAMIVVAGHVGKIPEIFTGDLLYHLGVGRTVAAGHLQGMGPYEGLPSYFGGLFPVALGVAASLGVRPEIALAVASWFEPAFWVGAGVVVARSLWPTRAVVRWAFVVLLLTSGGLTAASDRLWVGAPNIVGQAWWPLFPRDIAIMALLLGFAAAFRGNWWAAGLASAVAVSTQAQVGLVGTALCCLTLLFAEERRWGPAVAAGVLAASLSSWWWAPRVWWSVRWGLELSNGGDWIPLPITAATLATAYGTLLIFGGLGAWSIVRGRRPRSDAVMLGWLGASILLLAATAVLPDVAIAPRRAMVLMTIPLAGVAAVGVERILKRCRGWWQPVVTVILLAILVGSSVPAFHATRQLVSHAYVEARYSGIDYPTALWGPLWKVISKREARVLVPPGDAVVAWMSTGKPQAWMRRPGPIKTGYDVARATGWSEPQRARAVARAFVGGQWAMCRLMERRSFDAVLYRSRPGLLGVVDISPSRVNRADGVRHSLFVQEGQSETVGVVARQPLRRLSVWAAITATGQRVKLAIGESESKLPVAVSREGPGLRLDYDFGEPEVSGAVTIENTGSRGFRVIRVVGYARAAGVTGPATLVSRTDKCGDRAGAPAEYERSWDRVWSEMYSSSDRTLVTPGEADEAWLATGRPQISPAAPYSANLNRFLTRENGWSWSVEERRSDIASAFAGGSLCTLMTSHAIHSVLLQSRRGLVGIIDAVPRVTSGWRSSLRVPAGGERRLVDVTQRRLSEVSVWLGQQSGFREAELRMGNSGPLRPSARVDAGNAVRLDFKLAGRLGDGAVMLRNNSARPLDVLRTVGFVRSAASAAPAMVIDRERVCAAHW